ncbi:hypothetical protein PV10_01977 [Exophiala mesophila]|uniref:IgE-binding protein n=1 Tax=Exophiala mesophila TaxID=212818 RepID=A0A0D2A598_EXOME|nr:uncharacterized protein PV10_01977 [Exophiala mesophila]KIV94188.1 hypothetical protein PV10_01977 [Exophiala mesophila]
MHIKSTLIAALPALVAAAPTGSSGQNPDAPATFPSAYGLVIGSDIQPFHFESINANSGKFWLNLPQTVTSCPASVAVQGSCPPGNETVFRSAGDMATSVPGGQQVYVLPSGEILFTGAHANVVPEGAVSSPFVYEYTPGAEYGEVTTYAFGADGFMACPTHGSIAYQVYANVPNAWVPLGDPSACVSVAALAIPYNNGTIAAWQYD